MRCAHGFDRPPLRVTHGHPVPVRRQIVAGLASAVLDGRYAAGEALPSTRALARTLRVHRNTVRAAYRSLRDCDLIACVPGRTPRVVGARPTPRISDPGGLLRALVNGAWEAGLRRDALVAEVDAWRSDDRQPPLLLIEPRPGLRVVLGAELRTRACRALRVGDWRLVHRLDRPGPGGGGEPAVGVELGGGGELSVGVDLGAGRGPATVVVARPVLARRLARRLPGVIEIFPLVLAGGTTELSRALRIRLPGVVTLLTRSATVRGFARHLAAGHHASGLSVAAPDPTDFAAVRRAVRIARLILTDASCRGMPLETRAPVRELRVVSDQTVRSLRRYLGEQTYGG